MEIGFRIFISLIIKYTQIFLFILESKWRRNSCANRSRFFRESSGACSRTAVHFHLEQKTKFF